MLRKWKHRYQIINFIWKKYKEVIKLKINYEDKKLVINTW